MLEPAVNAVEPFEVALLQHVDKLANQAQRKGRHEEFNVLLLLEKEVGSSKHSAAFQELPQAHSDKNVLFSIDDRNETQAAVDQIKQQPRRHQFDLF